MRFILLHAWRNIPVDAWMAQPYNTGMQSRRSINQRLTTWAPVVLLIILCAYYYATLPTVPFHPDEATYIYMSSDFKLLFGQPLEMAYQPDAKDASIQRYRLIDPPLTRYVIGAGIWITNLEPLPRDWDWSASWQQNEQSGAMPSPALLLISRLSLVWVFPISLWAIYQVGKRLKNPFTGLLAMLLVGGNALILLHTRRAMEESFLTLGICLSLWSFSFMNRKPWLASLAVLLAINSKFTALALVPLGILAIFLNDCPSQSQRWRNLGLYLLILVAGTVLLNPILWKDPIDALTGAYQARLALITAQTADLVKIDPTHALSSSVTRFAALLSNVYFNPPSVLDVGNYRDALEPSIQSYFSIPGTSWLRGWIGGSIFFALSLFGFLLLGSSILFHRTENSRDRMILFLGVIITSIPMVWLLTLPFQRYVLLLIPFLELLIAYGVASIIQPIKKAPG